MKFAENTDHNIDPLFCCFFSRTSQDFGDGGAFPEIHLAQYPMNLGKPADAKSKSNALAVQLDASGKVKYDLIARQGHGKVNTSSCIQSAAFLTNGD
jgi:hypothetical protein